MAADTLWGALGVLLLTVVARYHGQAARAILADARFEVVDED